MISETAVHILRSTPTLILTIPSCERLLKPGDNEPHMLYMEKQMGGDTLGLSCFASNLLSTVLVLLHQIPFSR